MSFSILMSNIFEIIDKSGRKIHLTKNRWGEHIKFEHPDLIDYNDIKETLINPDKITEISEEIRHYYKYYKNRKNKSKFLKVIVKYLNQHGFVITAYFVGNIRIK